MCTNPHLLGSFFNSNFNVIDTFKALLTKGSSSEKVKFFGLAMKPPKKSIDTKVIFMRFAYTVKPEIPLKAKN